MAYYGCNDLLTILSLNYSAFFAVKLFWKLKILNKSIDWKIFARTSLSSHVAFKQVFKMSQPWVEQLDLRMQRGDRNIITSCRHVFWQYGSSKLAELVNSLLCGTKFCSLSFSNKRKYTAYDWCKVKGRYVKIPYKKGPIRTLEFTSIFSYYTIVRQILKTKGWKG